VKKNRNFTFERGKDKEVVKNCERKYSNVIEEEKKNSERRKKLKKSLKI
jgi:hypothetical protein